MNSPMHSRADASKAPLSLGLQDLSGEQRRGCSVLSARTSSMPGGVLKPLYKASIRKLNIQAIRTPLNIISLACRRSSRREPGTAGFANLACDNSPDSSPSQQAPPAMAIVCKRRAHCSSNGIPERSTNGWQLQAALARRATIARSGLTDPHRGR